MFRVALSALRQDLPLDTALREDLPLDTALRANAPAEIAEGVKCSGFYHSITILVHRSSEIVLVRNLLSR